MTTHTRQDTIDAGNGQDEGGHFNAYVAVPSRPNGRAVIVLQEIFGVTPAITEVADRYAKEGYLALAPDLFWRTEPGLALSHSREDMKRAFGILETFDDDKAVADIAATIAHAKAQPGITSVAVIGMCLGGKLTWLAAARLKPDAAIAFYGVGIEKEPGDAAGITSPLQMYFGAQDKYVTPEARGEVQALVKDNPNVNVTVIDDGDHGFYTRGAPEVIARVHAEALEFLDKHMGEAGAFAGKGKAS